MPGRNQGAIIEGEELFQALESAPEEIQLPSGLYQSLAGKTSIQAVDTSAMSATFVIVTNERNRHGNSHQLTATKLGKGLRTDQGFDSNPVVLFDHGLSGNPFPVARSSAIRRTAKQAVATATFPERLREIYPGNLQHADDLLRGSAAVFAGLAEGLIRMSSIGFSPILAMLRATDDEDQGLPQGVEKMDDWRGLHFTETELHEWSIVTIGADRGALKQSLDRGKIHDVRLPAFMRANFQQTLDDGEQEPTQINVPIDVSALESKIDQLVDRIGELIESQSEAVEEAGEVIEGDETTGEVATDPQGGTITPQQTTPKHTGEELAKQFLAKTEQRRGPSEAELLRAVDAATKPLAESIERVEREFRQRLGVVD